MLWQKIFLTIKVYKEFLPTRNIYVTNNEKSNFKIGDSKANYVSTCSEQIVLFVCNIFYYIQGLKSTYFLAAEKHVLNLYKWTRNPWSHYVSVHNIPLVLWSTLMDILTSNRMIQNLH